MVTVLKILKFYTRTIVFEEQGLWYYVSILNETLDHYKTQKCELNCCKNIGMKCQIAKNLV